MTFTREFYIPANARKISPKATDKVVFYVSERDGKLFALCFIGKAQKPAWNFRFLNEADRSKRIANQIAAIVSREEAKAARRAEAKKPHNLETGMILSGSWGYDQTNVDFFEVVKVVGKTMIEVERIGSQSATDAGNPAYMTDKVVPNPEHRTGEITRHVVRHGSIKSPRHGSASVWNGLPMYESSYH